jgi:predicted hydrolase (HD superfamily)
MTEYTPTYDEALSLLKKFNQSESLLKHAHAAEGSGSTRLHSISA